MWILNAERLSTAVYKRLRDPAGVTVGPDGTLWVADEAGQSIFSCRPMRGPSRARCAGRRRHRRRSRVRALLLQKAEIDRARLVVDEHEALSGLDEAFECLPVGPWH